jgi:hypothetical protein
MKKPEFEIQAFFVIKFLDFFHKKIPSGLVNVFRDIKFNYDLMS